MPPPRFTVKTTPRAISGAVKRGVSTPRAGQWPGEARGVDRYKRAHAACSSAVGRHTAMHAACSASRVEAELAKVLRA